MKRRPSVQLGYLIHYVENVPKAISFFESAFGFTPRFITDELDYGELVSGESTLAFASHKLAESHLPLGHLRSEDQDKPFGVEIALITDTVETVHAHALSLGATELTKPKTRSWGQTSSYIRCPAGILIELCSPVSS